MARLWQFMKQYTGMLLCAVALLFIQAMCDLALPDYMSNIIDKGVMVGDSGYIWSAGTSMLVVAFAGAAASITMGYFAAMIAANVARDMRGAIFTKVESFSNAEIDKFGSASLITRTTNDITQIQTLLVFLVRIVIYAPILGIGGVFKALSNSTTMTWVIGVAVICLIGVIIVLFSMTMPKFKLVQKLIDRLNLVTRENLEGVLVVRAFNTQQFELNRFDTANKNLTAVSLFVNRAMVFMMPFMMLVMNLTMVIIIWVGSNQVAQMKLEVGDMFAYMQYAMQIIMSFLMLSMMFIMVPRATVSANRLAEVLDTEETVFDPKEPLKYGGGFNADVEFRDVCFHYPGGEGDVLHHLNFTVRSGQTTAIIGSTGSGKTTIINLIMRFYDVTAGKILIDNKDIRDVTRHDLRDKIGYIPQKANLFSGTIKTNILYGDENASDAAIEKAADIAQASDFIAEKEEGLDTGIAEGGTNVSGGQRQRLSIARALVKNAPINIFDDSFSALDLKTDSRLRAALARDVADSTNIIVAQRVSTIMSAEQIIALDNGRIAGIGTHKELLKSCEVYRQIALSQLSEEELAI